METYLFIKDCEAFKLRVPPSMLVFFHQLFLHHMQVAKKVKQLLIISHHPCYPDFYADLQLTYLTQYITFSSFFDRKLKP